MNLATKSLLSCRAARLALLLFGAETVVLAAPSKTPSKLPVKAPLTTASKAASPLRVTDLAGRSFDLARSKSRATAIVFLAHDCPISNAYAPEIGRIAAQYGPRGVDFFVAYADSELSAAGARKHAKQFGLTSPLLLDSSHRLSAALGASVTPEAIVISPTGQRLYRGRINDRYVTWGKTRRISQNELRAALDAVVAGQRVLNAETRAVGCFIPAATK